MQSLSVQQKKKSCKSCKSSTSFDEPAVEEEENLSDKFQMDLIIQYYTVYRQDESQNAFSIVLYTWTFRQFR